MKNIIYILLFIFSVCQVKSQVAVKTLIPMKNLSTYEYEAFDTLSFTKDTEFDIIILNLTLIKKADSSAFGSTAGITVLANNTPIFCCTRINPGEYPGVNNNWHKRFFYYKFIKGTYIIKFKIFYSGTYNSDYNYYISYEFINPKNY